MQKLELKQKNIQRLTPQQIQLVKLLQIPSIDINQRIDQELATNPALAADHPEEEITDLSSSISDVSLEPEYTAELFEKKYIYRDRQAEERWAWRSSSIPNKVSLEEQLLEQLSMLQLSNREQIIGKHLIGSLEADGYIRRDITAITNDILFTQQIEATQDEVIAVLEKIQFFDPPGIGARTLQECLLIQLHRQPPNSIRELAIAILTETFEAFTKKHYTTITKKLGIIDQQLFKQALGWIAKLNPKPGGTASGTVIEQNQVLYPDFIVTKQGDQIEVSLSMYDTPILKIDKSYQQLSASTSSSKQHSNQSSALQMATDFAKKKIVAAAWFIEALKQRQKTLLKTMQAIVSLQHDFFLEGDETKIKPMILKHIAVLISMDVSTVSRIVSNKSVQTDFGIYPLKYFFTEAIQTDKGEIVSSQAVKQALATLIESENKQTPYADEELTRLLREQSFQIARRTVSKYREQLDLPVARLRKEL